MYMAAVFQTSSISNLAASTAISLTKPSGTVDGDLLITIICCSGTAAPSSVPSGWTLIRSNDSGGAVTQASIHSYYKVASSEGASYSWTASGGGPSGGMIFRITGQDSSPIDNSSGNGGQGAGTIGNNSSSGSTMTPSRVNELLIMAAVVFNSSTASPSLSGWEIGTSNPTWTEVYDNALNSGSGNNWVMGAAYALRDSTTATGAPIFDYPPGNGDRYAAQTILTTNLNAQTFTETITCTDTATTIAGFQLTVAETVTPTDTATAEREKTWATQNKSSTTWTNQDKS